MNSPASFFSVALLLLTLLSAPLKANELWYLGQKIPDVNRAWNSADYRELLQALKTIDETQPDALPRRDGSYTGAVFERMVSEDNLREQMDIYQSLDYRREEASRILYSLREIMRLYFDFSAKQQPYGREALSLMRHSLRQQAVLFELTVEFWLTLPESDQQSRDRLEGLMDTKSAAALLASSSLDYLSLDSQFNPDVLELYAYELGKTFPELFVHLLPDDRARLLTKVTQQSQQHKLPAVRQAMETLKPVLEHIDRKAREAS
ncbi:hypothetical protein [Parendozoicomonas haliclonae]|uniref:Uncharacterized protein n=1 Tax=Parendozoicomonas haliclonae TaxID=1960125 RepID=A0A1X7AF27_9GAMM|nr:hypothetical protein [Parendozoicomonas haliclonae]SMA34957.1 hypothetical protein EHSB41UT_00477 [Parendozoicomonas haliclonae]